MGVDVSMDMTNLIGTLAGVLTTIAFIPQVLKTWRNQSAHDISLFMSLLFNAGVLLRQIYGLILDAIPIVVANALTAICTTMRRIPRHYTVTGENLSMTYPTTSG